jgi:hypothetical protein
MNAQTQNASESNQSNPTIDLNSMSFDELKVYLAKVSELAKEKGIAELNVLAGFKTKLETVLKSDESFKSLVSRNIGFTVTIDNGNPVFKYSDKETHESKPVEIKYSFTDEKGIIDKTKKGEVYTWTGRGLPAKWFITLENLNKAKLGDKYNRAEYLETFLTK